jgi:hypothetical protein
MLDDVGYFAFEVAFIFDHLQPRWLQRWRFILFVRCGKPTSSVASSSKPIACLNSGSTRQYNRRRIDNIGWKWK